MIERITYYQETPPSAAALALDIEKGTTTAVSSCGRPRWFKRRGIMVERVMTVDGSGHVAMSVRRMLQRLGFRYLRIRPCTSKANDKAERVI